MSGGTVSGNMLSNINLVASISTGGGLIGTMVGGTISNNVVVSADISSIGENQTGGLIGVHGVGSVSSCFVAATVLGGLNVGGLIGSSFSSSITDSYFAGNVTSSGIPIPTAGGGVGSGGSLTNVYTTATVTATTNYGLAPGGTAVADSYWDSTISGTTTAGAGVGKSTSELQTPITATGIYADWSTDVWDFGTDSQYPALKGLRTLISRPAQCRRPATQIRHRNRFSPAY